MRESKARKRTRTGSEGARRLGGRKPHSPQPSPGLGAWQSLDLVAEKSARKRERETHTHTQGESEGARSAFPLCASGVGGRVQGSPRESECQRSCGGSQGVSVPAPLPSARRALLNTPPPSAPAPQSLPLEKSDQSGQEGKPILGRVGADSFGEEGAGREERYQTGGGTKGRKILPLSPPHPTAA